MQSRKYHSFQEAITDLESKGTLKYWGWMGTIDGYYLYTFVIKGVRYELEIYKVGLVKIKE